MEALKMSVRYLVFRYERKLNRNTAMHLCENAECFVHIPFASIMKAATVLLLVLVSLGACLSLSDDVAVSTRNIFFPNVDQLDIFYLLPLRYRFPQRLSAVRSCVSWALVSRIRICSTAIGSIAA